MRLIINNMTTIVYTRISSKNQSFCHGVHVSIENQLHNCTNYCLKNNLNIINHISEVVSAKNIQKQKQLLNLLNNNNINIIFYNISRFSRNTSDGLNFLNECKQKKINLHFVEENLAYTHYMDMHRLRVGLSQSEFESNTISNRITSNNSILRNKGWKFGVPIFGTQSVFQNGVRNFITNKDENEIIKLIILAREGKTSCRNLNKQLKIILPNNKEPIEYYDYEKDEAIEHFDIAYTLTFGEIANLLNSYNISIRGSEWNADKVNRVYNKSKNISNINFLIYL